MHIFQIPEAVIARLRLKREHAGESGGREDFSPNSGSNKEVPDEHHTGT